MEFSGIDIDYEVVSLSKWVKDDKWVKVGLRDTETDYMTRLVLDRESACEISVGSFLCMNLTPLKGE